MGNWGDAQSPSQGNFRQAVSVAPKCASVCGDMTCKQIRELADDATHWNTYLTRQLTGPKQTAFVATLAQYSVGELAQSAWEAAAVSLNGCRPKTTSTKTKPCARNELHGLARPTLLGRLLNSRGCPTIFQTTQLAVLPRLDRS